MLKKRLLPCIIVIACIAAVSACFVGCGKDYTANFAGTWRATQLTGTDGQDLSANVQQLNAANKPMDLTLSDDKGKTAVFDLAGESKLEGTWKPTAENTCEISFSGYTKIIGTLSDGMLTIDDNGQTMTLQKLDQ